jgi:disulfide bond formation protein DsbB/cytochrome c5
MKITLEKGALYLAQTAAWIAMMGSLWFSEVAHYIPCEWCWRQRILMYPMALILPIGILRKDENVPFYTLGLSGLGIGASTFHYLLQKTTWFNSFGSCSAGAPCSITEINWFGFVTIPFLALIAFAIIFVCSLLVITSNEYVWDEGERPAWVPTFGIIAIIVGVFLPSFLTATPAEVSPNTGTLLPGTNTAFVTDGVERGYDLYVTKCAACHGDNAMGQGGLGTALLGTEFTESASEEEWVQMVVEGRNGMPPRGGSPDLTDEDIGDILDFLRAQSLRYQFILVCFRGITDR